MSTNAITQEEAPSYIIELSKSGRATCKRCEDKIASGSVRVGIVIDSSMGVFTRWQHLDCIVFHKSIVDGNTLDGFSSLSDGNQELVQRRIEQSQHEKDVDQEAVDPDELVRKDWSDTMDAPRDLLMPLLPFQKEGLSWMVNQEQHVVKGGILADEMGMGKTIQAISLMLSNRPSKLASISSQLWDDSDSAHDIIPGSIRRGGTLVVVPTVALRQWQTEIFRFTRQNSLKVFIYHGHRRASELSSVYEADVVLTSYGILESEYRKATAMTKIECRICGRKYYPEKLRVHRKYFCGSTAKLTERQARTERKGGSAAKRKNNSKRGNRGAGGEDDDEGDGSEEDEVDRQKRMIKEMAEKKAGSMKNKASAGSTKSKHTVSEVGEEVEDEVDRQKRIIKEMANKKNKKTSTTTSSKTTSSKQNQNQKKVSEESKGASKDHQQQSVKKSKKRPVREEADRSGGEEEAADEDSGAKPTKRLRGGGRGGGRPPSRPLSPVDLSLEETPTGADTATTATVTAVSGMDSAEGARSRPVRACVTALPPSAYTATSPATFNVSSSHTPIITPKTSSNGTARSSGSISLNVSSKRIGIETSKGKNTAQKSYSGGKKAVALPSKLLDYSENDDDDDDDFVEDPKPRKVSRKPVNNRRAMAVSDSDSDSDFQANDDDEEEEGSEVSLVDESESDSETERFSKKNKQRSSSLSSTKVKSTPSKQSKSSGKSSSKKSRSQSKRRRKHSDDELSSGDEVADGDDDDDGDEDAAVGSGSDDDEDVERDIAEALKQAKKKPKSLSSLHMVSWFRVILDEAHMIKDRSSSTARAVFNLVSLNKWCLTGTPLQNRVGELYSLIRFLRVDPHAYYYCKSKNCSCKSLHYRFSKGKCEDCGHTAMHHFSYFNRHILNPIKKYGYVADGRKAMMKLKEQVLDEVLLRRTKTTRAQDIMLPPRLVRVRQELLDEREEDFYQALYTQSQAQFDTYVASGTVLNNYAHIFDILIRLRQAVDHPYLVIHSDSKKSQAMSNASSASLARAAVKEQETGEECCVCHDPAENDEGLVNRATCGHVFCSPCLTDLLNGSSNEINLCPECNEPLTVSTGRAGATTSSSKLVCSGSSRSKRSFLDKIDLSKFQSSTKLEILMQELYKMETNDPGAKALVFSQFVNMLELVEHRVKIGGLKTVKLLGNLSLEQRDKAITAFREDPKTNVMLISLKAGGVALNLIAANYIFLMDPWWNPAAEMQAIDRTHRIGQNRPIHAVRIIVKNSIEERLLALQSKKKLVFDGTVGGDSSSMARLTVDDMRFLFQ